jgi:hypothetical protein
MTATAHVLSDTLTKHLAANAGGFLRTLGSDSHQGAGLTSKSSPSTDSGYICAGSLATSKLDVAKLRLTIHLLVVGPLDIPRFFASMDLM